MGPSWTLKGNEESGMTLRFGALAPSKKVGCGQNTGNWEYFSAPPFPAHYFQRVLLVLALVNRHLIIPVKRKYWPYPQRARRNGCPNRSSRWERSPQGILRDNEPRPWTQKGFSRRWHLAKTQKVNKSQRSWDGQSSRANVMSKSRDWTSRTTKHTHFTRTNCKVKRWPEMRIEMSAGPSHGELPYCPTELSTSPISLKRQRHWRV